MDTIAINLSEVRPTLVLSVPRVFEKLFARVLDNALSGGAIKKNIFFWARGVAERWGREKLALSPVARIQRRAIGRSATARMEANIAMSLCVDVCWGPGGVRAPFALANHMPMSKGLLDSRYHMSFCAAAFIACLTSTQVPMRVPQALHVIITSSVGASGMSRRPPHFSQLNLRIEVILG